MQCVTTPSLPHIRQSAIRASVYYTGRGCDATIRRQKRRAARVPGRRQFAATPPSRQPQASETNDGAVSRVLLHVVPGLEDVVDEEVGDRFPDAELVGAWRWFDERTSILEYRTATAPAAWLALDTVEDVFTLAARAGGVSADRRGLAELGAAVLRAKALDSALAAHRAVTGDAPRTFRVVARQSGDHAYRRIDAQYAVESALRTRLPRVRQVEDDAEAEFWLTIIRATALIGLRLSGPGMRGHSRPFTSLPASLKPTVARAMALLSQPRATDRVLDPCCGAGTLLLERAAVAPYTALFGGDQDQAAVATTRANLAEYGIAADIRRWDALALPVANGSADVVLTNPPFGKQVEIPGGDAFTFYRQLLREIRRVLHAEGRLVLLTSQTEGLHRALRDLRLPLPIRRTVKTLVRGQEATIYVAGAE